MTNPERAILADHEALANIEDALTRAAHPLAKACYEADARYLRQLITTYEQDFFDAHETTS